MAKDVADVLGYRNGPDMIRHIDPEDTSSHKLRRTSGSGGGNPNVKIVNESGLYAAILRSRRPDAKKFKRHVTSEILPSIRKHGGYIQWQQDHLLIASPGGFPEGIMVENLLVHEPKPRNPSLAEAFRRIGLIEQTGRGVDKIFLGQLRDGRPAPDY